jgi:hypothetical protein
MAILCFSETTMFFKNTNKNGFLNDTLKLKPKAFCSVKKTSKDGSSANHLAWSIKAKLKTA